VEDSSARVAALHVPFHGIHASVTVGSLACREPGTMKDLSSSSPSDTSQAATVLARFPGPVTLYVGRRKKLIAIVLCVAFTAFMAWLALNPSARSPRFYWYSMVMAWISLMIGGGMSIRAVYLLMQPRSASLSLDIEAFEIGRVFRRVRVPWSDVSGFRADRTGARALTVMYEVLDFGKRSGSPTKVIKHFPDNYGLQREELASLMNEWREQSLAPRQT
jgi:hypothetical protein